MNRLQLKACLACARVNSQQLRVVRHTNNFVCNIIVCRTNNFVSFPFNNFVSSAIPMTSYRSPYQQIRIVRNRIVFILPVEMKIDYKKGCNITYHVWATSFILVHWAAERLRGARYKTLQGALSHHNCWREKSCFTINYTLLHIISDINAAGI